MRNIYLLLNKYSNTDFKSCYLLNYKRTYTKLLKSEKSKNLRGVMKNDRICEDNC